MDDVLSLSLKIDPKTTNFNKLKEDLVIDPDIEGISKEETLALDPLALSIAIVVVADLAGSIIKKTTSYTLNRMKVLIKRIFKKVDDNTIPSDSNSTLILKYERLSVKFSSNDNDITIEKELEKLENYIKN